MDQIGEGFQGDFFILPSSTHETLVIPDNGAFDYRVLEDMVQTINEMKSLRKNDFPIMSIIMM